MILKAKRSWSQAAPEEIPLLKKSCSWRIVLLKTRGPEATSSEAASSEAAEVISSEAASSEAASSEAISPEAEYQLDLQRIKNWRIINAKAVYWIRKHKQRISGVCNGHFKGVWRRVFAIWTKALTLYYCTNCTTTFSTTLFCVCTSRQENSSRIRSRLHRCSFG